MEKIKLGQKVKDNVTGFVGIAVSKSQYLNWCIRYEVVSQKTKDIQSMDIDQEQLEVIDDGILKKKKVTNTGGPKDFNLRNNTRLLTN